MNGRAPFPAVNCTNPRSSGIGWSTTCPRHTVRSTPQSTVTTGRTRCSRPGLPQSRRWGIPNLSGSAELAISSQQRVWVRFRQCRVDAIAQKLTPENWLRISAGDGMKGPRLYDWAAGQFGAPSKDGLVRWLLLGRSIEKPEEVAYYLCLAPTGTTLRDLAKAAGQRWNIECCFEAATQETRLNEYEVRSWHGWYRHITLSMLALAFLSVIRSRANVGQTRKKRPGNSYP